MERYNFLKKLDELLAKVPEEDRKEMLYDYEEHFSFGLANGKTEAEIVSELGDPYVIARDLLADYRQMKMAKPEMVEPENIMNQYHQMDQKKVNASRKQTSTSTVSSTLAAIGLGFFNLIFVLGPVLGLFGAYIGLWAAALVLLISPLFTLGSLFFTELEQTLMVFFLSLITCSLGIFLSVGLTYIGKYGLSGLRSYGKFNLKVIRGDKGEFVA